MLTEFARWKYWVLAAALLIGLIYSLPNVFGEDPAVQIIGLQGKLVDASLQSEVESKLQGKDLKYKSMLQHDGQLLIRFNNTNTQLAARDLLKNSLGNDYSVALNLAPATPKWLSMFGAEPMKLGLDLRGGVRFLMEVDVEASLRRKFARGAAPSEQEAEQFRNAIMDQTVVTLRNRVNELGVAEAVVQREGKDKVVVELPGIQDTARAKDILGKTATLDFMLEDSEHDLMQALQGKIPLGSKIYYMTNGRPVLLKNRVILTGDSIVSATSQYDSRDSQPIVAISLGGPGVAMFKEVTLNNINKAMAVIYRESNRPDRVISFATIRDALGDNFQISGMPAAEARDLALLLRAGALPANLQIVEERIIGPSMGQDNIEKGITSVVVGFSAVVLFMTVYYSLFGIIANIALFMNLIMLLALLSLVGATLTLPGIAGIVLTLGMAVDANVLIFERIREELRLGLPPHSSIQRGFDHAFSTIIDSNLTTLIVGIILYSIGTGPVKGFAVTLSLGILTSMFTSIMGTRAIVELIYGKRQIQKLPVGI